MYSKFIQHANAGILETQVDAFLKELEEVTGQIISLKMMQRGDEILVLIIYSCWKKL
jgi:hypothetical protein